MKLADGKTLQAEAAPKPVSKAEILVAIKHRRSDLRAKLEAYIAAGNNINTPYNSKKQHTFLHYAAKSDSRDGIIALVERGADFRVCNDGTPLHFAVRAGSGETIQQIFDSFVALSPSDTASTIEAMKAVLDQEGFRADMAAVLIGKTAVLEQFFTTPGGITYQYRTNDKVFSAFDLAAQSSNPKAFYSIIERGTTSDGKKLNLALTKDYSGKNCLDYAIERNNITAVRFLLSHSHINNHPEESLKSLLHGKEILETKNLQARDVYVLVTQKIERLQAELKRNPQLRETATNDVVTSLGELPVYEQEITHTSTEAKSTLLAATTVSAGIKSERHKEDELLELPTCEVRIYNEEQVEREKIALEARKNSLWSTFENQSTVALRVDEERERKVADLKTKQTGNEGRAGLAERIDAERQQKIETNGDVGVVSVAEAMRIAKDRDKATTEARKNGPKTLEDHAKNKSSTDRTLS